MRTIIAFLLILHAQIAAGQKEGDEPRLLNGYFAIADSLSRDNLPVARSIAAGMVKFHPGSPLSPPAEAIAKSKSIEIARSYFKDLTWAARIWVHNHPEAEVQVYYCPMAAGGRGAEWLQRSKVKANNPYMGSKMLRCGTLMGK